MLQSRLTGTKKIKVAITLTLLVIISYYGWIYIFTGSFNGCEDTEQILTIPQELQNITIISEHDMYLVQGGRPESCSPNINKITNQIFNQDYTGAHTSIDEMRLYFQKGNVSTMQKGKKFLLDKVVTITSHGLIAGISGSSGPNTYLILKDEQGTLYYMGAIFLEDINHKNGLYLGYYQDGNKIGMLTWGTFGNILK